ncbi:hypothetical protein HPB47_003083 [Ixodes persulcatus]|uniref:Uncharacterized protein n=1 Tax=Ixodes persulcatus TaxID=34615 RepID=A0AC60PL26_IXOPE|nr:hypothetical protein HPB47_003083 [Ixodes persulcatus]
MGNADQTPVWFDRASRRMATEKAPFKDRVGVFYSKWMSRDDNPKTPTGRVKRASLSTVAHWVNDG